jgi:cell division protein FtsL
MKKVAALTWLTAIAIAALGLFHVKYEVQRLEKDLSQEQQLILEHREAIHVLKAEWSFLNQPTRISELAVRHLGLAPMIGEQVVQLEVLPERKERPNDQDEAPAAHLEATLASAKGE